jgi:hypothetical protein
VPHDAVLKLYQVHAMIEGTDAQAEVSVRLSENDGDGEGRGSGAYVRLCAFRVRLVTCAGR